MWNIIDDLSSFEVCGIPVNSYPVHHGVYFSDPPSSTSSSGKPSVPRPLICLAFMFDDKVLYMGDVSEVPDRTWEALGTKRRRKSSSKRLSNGDAPVNGTAATNGGVNGAGKIKSSGQTNGVGAPPRLPIFVVDALWPLRAHFSHFSLAQAMSAALELEPSVTYTLGSTHPTTHFMWEEVCRSFVGEDGQRPEHPDAEISRGLVGRVRKDVSFSGKEQIAKRWRDFGGKIEPAWDGLGLMVGDDGTWKEIPVQGGWSI